MKNDRADGERDDLQYNEEGESLVKYWLHPILPTLRSTTFLPAAEQQVLWLSTFRHNLRRVEDLKEMMAQHSAAGSIKFVKQN